RNWLRLFSDVHAGKEFSLNVYGTSRTPAEFKTCANLVSPLTLAPSLLQRPVAYGVPGLRTLEGRWDLRPHPNRVVVISEEELGVFAKLVGEDDISTLAVRL